MVSTLTNDELKAQLSLLDEDVRADLAKFLIDSLGAPPIHYAAEEWEAELDRRLHEIQSGKAKGARQVLAELREKYS